MAEIKAKITLENEDAESIVEYLKVLIYDPTDLLNREYGDESYKHHGEIEEIIEQLESSIEKTEY